MEDRRDPFFVEPDFIFQALANNNHDYVYIFNFEQDTYVISDNMAEDFSLEKRGDGLWSQWEKRLHSRDKKRVGQALSQIFCSRQAKFSLEYQAVNVMGKYLWISDKATVLYKEDTGEPRLIVGVLRDLAVEGSVDPVTGLLMHDECEKRISLAQTNRADCCGSIMLMGVDDFASINTLNDHAFGDLVLRNTAQDILSFLSDGMEMYRFDGDQFLIRGEKLEKSDFHAIYEKIQEYTAAAHQVNKTPYRFTVSAGVVSYPEDGCEWSDLEKAASTALKRAKDQGKDCCVDFEKRMLEKRIYEQSLRSRLNDSVENHFKGFRVVYQPVCDAQTLRIKGAEALMRFETPEGEPVTPLKFIPVLEQSGLIHQAGLWVLEQAVSTCKKWTEIMPDFVMNVNVSYIQLRDAAFCDRVEELLQKYDLDIRHLTLELTESYFITDAPNINKSIRRLKELRLQVAMDDFGTGYSSLARLSQFSVDIVKIDRSFIQGLHKRKYNYDFVDSVVRLCHNVGMKVCIEGVETREEQTSVSLLNADYIQGFYISRPIGESEFFEKYILCPDANDGLQVVPDLSILRSQLRGDRNVLLDMMDSSPYAISFWNRDIRLIACNERLRSLFAAEEVENFRENFFAFSPEYQPDGQSSEEKARELINRAFEGEQTDIYWIHRDRNGEEIPVEVRLVRIPYGNDYIVVSYTRDMRDQRQMEERIERFSIRLKALLDATPLCLNLWNRRFENLMCNREAVKLFELDSEQDYTDHFFELSPVLQPDGIPSNDKAMAKIREAFETGWTQFFWMHRNLRGEEIPAEITLVRIEGLGEDADALVAGFTRDIRTQLEGQHAQQRAAERISAVLDSVPLACILWTTDLDILDCNQFAVSLFDASDKLDVIQNFDLFIPKLQPDLSDSMQKKAEKFEETMRGGSSFFEWVYQTRSGEEIPCAVTLVKVELAEEELVVAYSRDLRQLHQTLELNDRLAKIAYFDLLTGCASRMKFMEKLEERFQNSGDGELALVMFDIDLFKTVNDTYGHASGDRVLKQVVKCVEKLLPEDAILGRYGGDEFTIQISGIDRENLEKLLDSLVHGAATLRFYSEGSEFAVSISAGATFKDPGDQSHEQMMIRADKALYEAKTHGRNRGVVM